MLAIGSGGELHCFLNYSSDRGETFTAHGSSPRNMPDFLQFLCRPARYAALRFLRKFLPEDINTTVRTFFANMSFRSRYQLSNLVLRLAAERAFQNRRAGS